MSRYKDITGQIINGCEALRYIRSNKRGDAIWLFKCPYNGPGCKGSFERQLQTIKSGYKSSCGCHKKEDVKGQIFHEMCKALNYIQSDSKGHTIWQFECLYKASGCKKIFEARLSNVRNGQTKTCGCYRYNQIIQHNTTHGLSNSPEYKKYYDMLQRCYNPNTEAYQNYGKRGIKVCDRWLGKDGFINFYKNVGPMPNQDSSPERPNNDYDYDPENFRWIPQHQQAWNRRNTVINGNHEANTIIHLYESKRCSIQDLVNIIGCSSTTLYNIIHNRTWRK